MKRKYKGSDFIHDGIVKCDYCDFRIGATMDAIKDMEGERCPVCTNILILPIDVLMAKWTILLCAGQASMLNFLPEKTAARIFENTKSVNMDTKDMADR